MTVLPRLYAVADRTFGDPVQLAVDLLEGGARLVQIRDKVSAAGRLLIQVESVMRNAPPEACIVVNDRADVARLAGAGGVHLGQADLPPASARKVLDRGQILGCSTHNLEQALAADETDLDYIAAGPVFPTQTRQNPDPALGLDRLREICSRVRKPVVAIGGITLDKAWSVLDCGASSVAVIGGLLRDGNVRQRTREWVECLELSRGRG